MVQLLGINMKKFYLHVPELTGWQLVFAEMLEKMNTSGLIDAVDEINFCTNGVRSNMELVMLPLLNTNSKFKQVHVNGDAAKWEWPTINQLKLDADSSDEDHYIGYAHLKGLSRPDITDAKAVDWRNYLSYWTIEQWEESMKQLDAGAELVGVNWLDQPWPHLSGNFWWATSNYIRRLPKLQDPSTIAPGQVSKLLKPNVILDPGNVRYECEAWIGQSSPKVHVLHASHAPADASFHYNNEYPSSNYRTE
jgi:hypothetical protein